MGRWVIYKDNIIKLSSILKMMFFNVTIISGMIRIRAREEILTSNAHRIRNRISILMTLFKGKYVHYISHRFSYTILGAKKRGGVL